MLIQQQLKNRIYNLNLAKTAPPGKVRDMQIEDFFSWVSELDSDFVSKIDDQISGDLRYREVVCNFDKGIFFSVIFVQSTSDKLLLINTNFNDEAA